MKQTFPKSERLHSKKKIEEVFEKGRSIKEYPFVLKYLPCDFETGSTLQIVIAVPKKRLRKAVDRNRMKRQIREAYRLNKGKLLKKTKNSNNGLALFLIYTGGEKENFNFLEDKLKLILQEVEKRTK